MDVSREVALRHRLDTFGDPRSMRGWTAREPQGVGHPGQRKTPLPQKRRERKRQKQARRQGRAH